MKRKADPITLMLVGFLIFVFLFVSMFVAGIFVPCDKWESVKNVLGEPNKCNEGPWIGPKEVNHE